MMEKLVPYTPPAQYARKERPKPLQPPQLKKPSVPRLARTENVPPSSARSVAPQAPSAPPKPPRSAPQAPRRPVQPRQTKNADPRSGPRPSSVQQMFDVYEPGEGIYKSQTAEIFTAVHRLTRVPVVLKGIDATKHPRPKELRLAIHKYGALCHPHVCRLVECWDSMRLVLVLEHIEGVTLGQFMAEIGCEPDQAREIIRQTAEGLSYCHAQGVAHCDLRLENIMLQSGAQACVKLIDFCCSAPTGRSKSARPYTAYAAPEAASGEHDRQANDVYALGVVAHALLLGSFPSPPAEGELPLPEELPPPAAALLRGMLSVDPAARLTSRQVCENAWLSGKSEEAAKADDPSDEVAVDMLDFEVLQELEALGLREVSASVEKGLQDEKHAAYKCAVLRKLRFSFLHPDGAAPPRAAAATSFDAVRAPPADNNLTPVAEAEEVVSDTAEE